jgi:hypothetical protein
MRYDAMSPLLGTTPPDAAARAVRFIMARPHGEYTDVDIAGTIVPAYFSVCASVGLALLRERRVLRRLRALKR